jgi:fatty-acyl-CoA synthase
MQLATAKAGLVLVNINPAYRTAEVEYALNKVGCKALVTMPRFKTSDYLGMLRELRAAQALPQLQHAIWIDVAGEGAEEPGFMRFSDLMKPATRKTRACRRWRACCTTGTPSTSSSPAAPPAFPRAPR